jgi:hypothetical protein
MATMVGTFGQIGIIAGIIGVFSIILIVFNNDDAVDVSTEWQGKLFEFSFFFTTICFFAQILFSVMGK